MPRHTDNHWLEVIAGAVTAGIETYDVKTYGALGDGTTDDTSAIQAALNTAAGAGGGVVFLPTGTYITGNLAIDSYVTLAGTGYGSVLSAKTGTTAVLSMAHTATTVQTGVRDLKINCNYRTSCYGIKYDANGSTSAARHQFNNVMVINAGADAYWFDNGIGETYLTNCRAFNALGHGFNVKIGMTDSHFVNCMAGACAGNGFEIAGNDDFFTACKAYWSGFNSQASTWNTTSIGFHLSSVSYDQLLGCMAEQSALHGFDINNCSQVTLVGCDATSNSAGTTGGVGFNTNTVTHSSITGCAGSNNGFLSPGSQAYGVQVAGTQTGLLLMGNTVTGTSGEFNYVSGFGYVLLSNSNIDFSGIPTKVTSSLQFGTNTTGAGSASLGTNSPATTNTGPYTWIQAKSSDNSTVYIPAWK